MPAILIARDADNRPLTTWKAEVAQRPTRSSGPRRTQGSAPVRLMLDDLNRSSYGLDSDIRRMLSGRFGVSR